MIYPTDWYPLANANQQAMTNMFVEAVEAYLGIGVIKLSILKEWSQIAPEELRSTSLIDYLGVVRTASFPMFAVM